jgi:replication-associated recombination protein RarA
MADHPFDPWTRVRTIHDLPADEVISCLQKSIRRGMVENACLVSYEMMHTSPELERYMWDRLAIISVEDIGFGETMAPVVIHALERLSQRFERHQGDRFLFGIHAVRYLATRFKDRSSDEMYNWMLHAVENEGLRPQLPDWVIDMHTARGQAMGRAERHFLEEGAKVDPELPDREKKYYEILTELWKD